MAWRPEVMVGLVIMWLTLGKVLDDLNEWYEWIIGFEISIKTFNTRGHLPGIRELGCFSGEKRNANNLMFNVLSKCIGKNFKTELFIEFSGK